MTRATLLVHGIGELATLARGPVPRTGPAMRDLGLVRGGAIAVDGGRVVALGPEEHVRRVTRLRPGGHSWDAEGACVVPGWVDAHTHALFAGERHAEVGAKVDGATYGEIAAQGGGLYSTVRATREADDATLLSETRGRLDRMARHGATTIEVKSGYALEVDGELRLLRLIHRLQRATRIRLVPTFLGAHAVPSEFDGRADAYVDTLVREALPAVAASRLARFCDVFCEPGFFDGEQSKRLLVAARSLGLGTKIHADEFHRSGGAQMAARLRVDSADHLLATTAEDHRALARAKVPAVLLPVTPFASMASLAPVGRDLVDAGAVVALGSDLSPNSWVESMGMVLSHAVYGARLTPAEAITAATVNSAVALGLSSTAGTLAVGRDADFSVYRTGSVEEIPYRIGPVPERVYRQGIRVSSR